MMAYLGKFVIVLGLSMNEVSSHFKLIYFDVVPTPTHPQNTWARLLDSGKFKRIPPCDIASELPL